MYCSFLKPGKLPFELAWFFYDKSATRRIIFANGSEKEWWQEEVSMKKSDQFFFLSLTSVEGKTAALITYLTNLVDG